MGGALLQDTGTGFACVRSGQDTIQRTWAKPAREVRAGDKLHIENDSGIFEMEVLAVSGTRGPAAVAQTLYRETDASREARLQVIEERKAMQQFAPLPEGRPSKRDRRRIIQFRRGK